MSNVIKIRKGYDIKLAGAAEQKFGATPSVSHYALIPDDFNGVIPKLEAREGDKVLAGDPVFYSKEDDRIKVCAPVSGEIAEVVRGEKRKILAIRILPDSDVQYRDFGTAKPGDLSREDVIERMLKSGVWASLQMRPYGRMANPDDSPKAIFISGMNSNPLAPDMNFVMSGQEKEFQAGLDALAKLTEGKIHLSLEAGVKSCPAFEGAQGVVKHQFDGPHPAGNVGTQIHHIDPINKGEVVWTMNPQDVVVLGRLFLEGKYRPERIVALTGSQVEAPQYYKLTSGASLKGVFEAGIKGDNNRYISGNVLTGRNAGKEGYLGYNDEQLTVIPEGDETEFLGWVLPGFGKFSLSRTFFSWLTPNKKYELNTNMHGEERAFVVTGQYERVFPFNIYPQQLIKAVMIKDIELMESLGIYEVTEEDFALCEVICTSKLPLQETMREGLDFMYKEMN
ncbi:Na(+)-translocating NADH-quinone reductase subunit A [Phaeocystidibacter luteus]|uniref:Na(+)-translocating NADH-quinone reductase subunit A n=1 Tax=Phaeocystidibacter luteus TaxID=911197 RepID=A0A6N6RJH5_9FLAO|nr:Na(+)-translocating NADH-quinone reductase subunit A [Phaeocystidibacter luteus]KAB2807331.1 Na(+)-translocating NADH-quinone reductase subunit A [Phaeocystidibacter luteus]